MQLKFCSYFVCNIKILNINIDIEIEIVRLRYLGQNKNAPIYLYAKIEKSTKSLQSPPPPPGVEGFLHFQSWALSVFFKFFQ